MFTGIIESLGEVQQLEREGEIFTLALILQ